MVPVVRKRRVNGDKEGVSARPAERKDGTGYSAYGTMAVKTTRTVSRGLERERSAESWRRRECAGWEAATLVRMSEAF